jgi:predicted amidophosphoribosyltransferase
MTRFFCSNCWNEVKENGKMCPWCGYDLHSIEDEGYDSKLVRALSHFEPGTAMRAAQILAMRNTKEAAEAIERAFLRRSDIDPIMARTFIEALANVTGQTQREVAVKLKEKVSRSSDSSKMKLKILDAIIGVGQ